MNEWEEDHQFHCHPLAEDHSLPNRVYGAHVVRKRSCKKYKTNFTYETCDRYGKVVVSVKVGNQGQTDSGCHS